MSKKQLIKHSYSEAEIRTRITQLREEKGYTQDWMAQMMGITKTEYQNLETGITPLQDKHITLISKILPKSLDYICTGKVPTPLLKGIDPQHQESVKKILLVALRIARN